MRLELVDGSELEHMSHKALMASYISLLGASPYVCTMFVHMLYTCLYIGGNWW